MGLGHEINITFVGIGRGLDIFVKVFGREIDIFVRDSVARWIKRDPVAKLIFYKGTGREKDIKLKKR
jgi:hypothetical protein